MTSLMKMSVDKIEVEAMKAGSRLVEEFLTQFQDCEDPTMTLDTFRAHIPVETVIGCDFRFVARISRRFAEEAVGIRACDSPDAGYYVYEWSGK